MRSFEIFVAPETRDVFASFPETRKPTTDRSSDRRRASEVLDLFVNGANLTACIPERHASYVLRDIASALVELIARPRGKRIVRFYEDAWELCVERLGDRATLSVYRGGATPTVLAYDRVVDFHEMLDSVEEAIASRLDRGEGSAISTELTSLSKRLSDTRRDATPFDLAIPEAEPVAIELDRDAPIAFRRSSQ